LIGSVVGDEFEGFVVGDIDVTAVDESSGGAGAVGPPGDNGRPDGQDPHHNYISLMPHSRAEIKACPEVSYVGSRASLVS
jgi:hypothetical protein